jgi:thiamine pyrophosphate-dependent acetolactate synthase large subunit-like protein
MLTKEQLLGPLAAIRTDEVVVTCMGVTRPWGRISDHELDFASADSAMGHTADLALGIALAQPGKKVICLNGDGSMLMNLGTLVTIAGSGAKNLILFVLENGTYEITGNQPIPGAGKVDFPGLARAAGFPRVYSFNRDLEYEATLPEILEVEGPVFVGVGMEPGTEGPISRSSREESRYLQTSLAHCAAEFREAITRERI